MDYFRKLQDLLRIEKEADRDQFERLTAALPVSERRANGTTWYPVAIRDTETGYADYLTVELERTTHQDIIHQLRFGITAALFSNHDAGTDRIEGVITYAGGDRIKLSLRTDELPEWTRNGKLGVDVVFDENSYREMENALKTAATKTDDRQKGALIQILTGSRQPTFHPAIPFTQLLHLNEKQQEAVTKILTANELAIVHGPPGTGKTTTLVQAIRLLVREQEQRVLVVAPSNAAVDLLSERLAEQGLNVVRVGNPARVSTQQLALTLDSRMNGHSQMKEIKRLKKRATEFRDLAHKYKRNFGKEERDQRQALYAEARSISKEVERTEQYIVDDILSKADVITATLAGANHYTVRHLSYTTVVIDEAGQAMEPACWIPILKAEKVVMAGDHFQLPPTIKSDAASALNLTLMEKCVAMHPQSVVLLEEQYRMHEKIMEFPSREFYNGKLHAHSSVAKALVVTDEEPMQFIDTAGCGFEEKWEGTSISNPEEAGFLIQHLSAFVSKLLTHLPNPPFPRIAVISPYKHQVEVLKNLVQATPGLQAVPDSIAVNTIDSFQGQERDVVYISMTRSNADQIIGFLSETRRMNVAMTRAKKKLVVIGDSSTLSQFGFYNDLISYTQEQNGYVSAWEFML